MSRFTSRLLLLGTCALVVWSAVFAVAMVSQLADAADRVHAGAGQPMFWSLLTLLAATVLAPSIWLLRLPPALRHPPEGDAQALADYATRLRAHLARNPRLAGRPLDSMQDVEAALTVLRDAAETETRRSAASVLASTALLQNGRLVRLGRDLRDHVIERLPDGALPADWPNPHWLGMPPRSPLAAVFHDEDWLALERGDDHWPVPDPADVQAAVASADPRARLARWRDQTVAEMKFGLTCVRSCLWASFAAPVVLLAMQEVFPFALEWEQSAVALGSMTLAFVVSAWLSIALERAPLIGQMFTKDAQHVSLMDLMRILGTKLLVLLLMLAATLTPNLGEWLQNFVGVLRI